MICIPKPTYPELSKEMVGILELILVWFDITADDQPKMRDFIDCPWKELEQIRAFVDAWRAVEEVD